MKGTVKLEYGLVDGKPIHVSQVDDLPPSRRPPAVCPECRTPVIWRCGEKNEHHLAHKTEAWQCAAARSEGALHLNAKLHLAELLRQTHELRCAGSCLHCRHAPNETVFHYEQVETEYVYGGRMRADIALLLAGQLVATVEIFVTHRAEQNKLTYHVSHALPCLEMRAENALDAKLPILLRPSAAYGVPEYTCEDCLAVLAKQREKRATLEDSFICGRLIAVFDRERWRKTVVTVEYLRQQNADGQPQVLQKVTPFYSFRLDSNWYPDEQVSAKVLSVDADEKSCVNRSFTEYRSGLIVDRSFLGYRSGWCYRLFDFERVLETTLPMSLEDVIRYFRMGYNTLPNGREPPVGFGYYDVPKKQKSSPFSDSLARILYGE